MFGVMRLKLNSICPGSTHFIVVGIIIAKQNPKVIISKRDNKEISVFSFTLRDSPEDVVNVNIWGSNNYINNLHNHYKIGDVVDLINANVKFRRDLEDKYMPNGTSSFFLTLNENSSQMLLHDVNDSSHYKNLLRIPTCPQSMYLKIEDINSCGKEICGKYCSLLVAVRCVMPTKFIKTKIGKESSLKEIIVMDKTHPTLNVKIWNTELIEKSAQWIPKKTILSIADVYLEWNIFKRNVTAVVTNKTIITEDPIINEAHDLKNYANKYLIGLSNKININIPNLSTITNIMTCKRILIKSNEECEQFTAVLYAIVSKFNIDGLFPLVFTKCNFCGINVESTYFTCLNPECPSNLSTELGSYELESVLNIQLSLTDSTGSVENCILHHQAATKIFSKVNNFQNMSLDQKTELKWKYLFTNCAIKLVVTKPHLHEKSTILVVDIDNTGPIFQFISHIPIY